MIVYFKHCLLIYTTKCIRDRSPSETGGTFVCLCVCVCGLCLYARVYVCLCVCIYIYTCVCERENESVSTVAMKIVHLYLTDCMAINFFSKHVLSSQMSKKH